MRRNRLVAVAALALLVLAAPFGLTLAARTQAAAGLRLMGPQGERIVVTLPELAKVPALDLAAACDRLAGHEGPARRLRAANPAAMAGCAGAGERGYPFYVELGDVLLAGAGSSRFEAQQMLAAMREALRSAPSADAAAMSFRALDARAADLAEPLRAPALYLVGAEALAAHAPFCTGENAARCRVETHSKRGQRLTAAGRWRGDADYLHAGIAAYREALDDAAAKSPDWVELHILIGSALARLSEQMVDRRATRVLLRQALDEYRRAAGAVEPENRSTRALINRNVCSIRQTLAGLEIDRLGTRRAIEECDKARTQARALSRPSASAAGGPGGNDACGQSS